MNTTPTAQVTCHYGTCDAPATGLVRATSRHQTHYLDGAPAVAVCWEHRSPTYVSFA